MVGDREFRTLVRAAIVQSTQPPDEANPGQDHWSGVAVCL